MICGPLLLHMLSFELAHMGVFLVLAMGMRYTVQSMSSVGALDSVTSYLSNPFLSLWSKSWLKRLVTTCILAIKTTSLSTIKRTVRFLTNGGRTKYRYRRTSRRWYVRQHKRGRRIRSARICQVLPPLPSKHSYFGSHNNYTTYGLPSSSTGTNQGTRRGSVRARFDTDSIQLGVDSCATSCMTNDKKDYVPGTMVRINRGIRGLGHTRAEWKGTVRWTIQDDNGVPFQFEIHDVLLVTNLPFRIFSPQHWAQCVRHKYGYCKGEIDHEQAVLHWNEGANQRHIKLTENSNIALLYTAPSYHNYVAFLSEIDQDPTLEFENFVCFPATSDTEQQAQYVTDDEEEDDPHETGHNHDTAPATNQSTQVETIDPDEAQEDEALESEGGTHTDEARQQPIPIDFGDYAKQDGPTYPEKALTDEQAELMRWHYRLSHAPFSKLRLLARNGEIPMKLQYCKTPVCPACTYGKMTKRPWRTKQQPNKIEPVPVTKPGDCVSVDQLESTTPGFIAQLKGFLTFQRYTCATVFTDHYSRLSRVYIQKNLSAEENIKSKKLWEAFCKSHGVQTKHYHADNGHFADAAFLADVARQGQTITFCGVNSHFQNGISEKRIRDLQEAARTSLLDATSRWPRAIAPSLWPYALRFANDVYNVSPHLRGMHEGRSPLEIFADIEVRSNVKHFHPFGCPVYCLQNKLQANQNMNKWLPRARLGIYLGFSPNHARSVALILNPQTGLVSPQYHVKFDDLWETVEYPRNKVLDHSEWQRKAGFTDKRGRASSDPRAKRPQRTREPVRDELPQESPPMNDQPPPLTSPVRQIVEDPALEPSFCIFFILLKAFLYVAVLNGQSFGSLVCRNNKGTKKTKFREAKTSIL